MSTALSLLPEEPWHVQTVRHSPVSFRIATNVVHDLLIHDLDLVARLFHPGRLPSVAAAELESSGGFFGWLLELIQRRKAPAQEFRARLDKALADDSPLTSEQRSARGALVSGQVSIR